MLKKFSAVTTLVFSLLLTLTQSAVAQQLIPSAPELAAKAWILVDASTGYVIAENNADQQLPPASLAKMMTTYIATNELASGRLKESDEVLVSEHAWRTGGAGTDGSTMFLKINSRVPAIDMIRGVIIQSGNDASIALAEHISGAEDAFAEVMNHQASLLGMNDTTYYNATGLPAEGMLTTARDLSKLARAIVNSDSKYYGIYAEKYFEHNGINQPNRNRLLWRDSSVDGLKTGHTEAAGYCLVASAKRNDMRLVSVVLGTSSEEIRARESQKLLAYGFRHYTTKKLYSSGEVLKSNVRVWYGEQDYLNLTIADDVVLTFARGGEQNLQANLLIDEQLEAPIAAGQELGRLQVTLADQTLIDVPLVAEVAIPESGLFSRLIDWIVLFFNNLLA